jgi:hypothetical protein
LTVVSDDQAHVTDTEGDAQADPSRVGVPLDVVQRLLHDPQERDRARETCPVFPGSENTLHWGLDDPSEVEGTDAERLAAFRRTQLVVSTRLRPFIEVALRAAGRRRASTVTQ